MKNVLTAAQTLKAEERVMKNGVDVMFLRMNAALAVADCIYPRSSISGAKTAVFCGRGGNGYDGILAAMRLHRQGVDVSVYLACGDAGEIAPALSAAKAEGLPVFDAADYNGGADIIIDAIFGIGLKRPIDGDLKTLIEKLNGENAFKLAVDIPSGLNPDTGDVMGVAFRADVTVTFSCYKYGMLFGEGREMCGRIVVEDVGVQTESVSHVCEDGDFKPYKRKANAHKGDCGRVFVIGGCANMIGAPILAGAAAHAANLNGAGTVTVCVPELHRIAMSSRSTLSMMRFLRDTPDGFIKFDKSEFDEIISRANAIDIGMGMGKAPDLKRMISYLCQNFSGTLIIDADGLNALGGDCGCIAGSKCKVILTPHVGEFKRLTGKSATIENAVELSEKTGAIVVLKSATTIITDGKEVRLNVAGTPALAKGGSGDVLGGCIAALTCSFAPIDAATIACYRNGMGAERAVSSYAEMMLTPKEMLKLAGYDEL